VAVPSPLEIDQDFFCLAAAFVRISLEIFKDFLKPVLRSCMKKIKSERTTTEYEISRNSSALESTYLIMNQEFIETQRRKLMTMMQKF
jgi:hypothetical protein